MSNRWGNFCTPEDVALSKGAYPGLHCYTLGEIIGILFVIQSGLISTIALIVAFLIIFINARRHPGRRLIQQPMDVFLLSLFVSEFILSVGTTFSIKWIHDGKVQTGAYCQAQGVLVGLAPAVMGWTTLTIAIYTFVRVWWQKWTGKRALAIAWVVVALIWIYETLMVSLSARRFHGNNFYHPSPYWCYIGKYYLAQILVGEYVWIWLAMIISLILYTPLFLLNRGIVEPDPEVWWKFKIRLNSERTHLTGERKRSFYMIAYPLVYAVTVIPNYVVRWVGIVEEHSGNHINHIPVPLRFVVRSIFGLSGLANVTLFVVTRPNLPLLGLKDDDADQPDEPSPASNESLPQDTTSANDNNFELLPRRRNTTDGNYASGSGNGPGGTMNQMAAATNDTPNTHEAEMRNLASTFGWHLEYTNGRS